MSIEAEEIQRIISASVRDMLDAYRIQAQAGPVTDKALEETIFRAAHGVVQSLAKYPRRVTGRAAAERGADATGDLSSRMRKNPTFDSRVVGRFGYDARNSHPGGTHAGG